VLRVSFRATRKRQAQNAFLSLSNSAGLLFPEWQSPFKHLFSCFATQALFLWAKSGQIKNALLTTY
jgi:hypothetical protein